MSDNPRAFVHIVGLATGTVPGDHTPTPTFGVTVSFGLLAAPDSPLYDGPWQDLGGSIFTGTGIRVGYSDRAGDIRDKIAEAVREKVYADGLLAANAPLDVLFVDAPGRY